MTNLSFAETLSLWILIIIAVYASGFVYQRFWRYFYQQLGWRIELQTEQGNKEENQRILIIAWGSGFAIACLLIRGIWQLEPLHKGLVIFGSPLVILACGFLGLSVPEIYAIWHKWHK